MKKRFEWKTEKGAAIAVEIESGFVTKNETISADGYTHDTKTTTWDAKVVALTVNGTAQNAPTLGRQNGKPSIDFTMHGRACAILIPNNIHDDYTAELTAHIDAMAAAEEQYQAETKAIYKAMNP